MDVKTACEKVRELSGDIADTLEGWTAPGDNYTYRGTLLHELHEAAPVLKRHAEATLP
jgi:hypothetical protein